MMARTRTILWLVFLLIGMQCAGDLLDAEGWRASVGLGATNEDGEEREPGESHHLTLPHLADADATLIWLDRTLTGPALSGRTPPSIDSARSVRHHTGPPSPARPPERLAPVQRLP